MLPVGLEQESCRVIEQWSVAQADDIRAQLLSRSGNLLESRPGDRYNAGSEITEDLGG